jgi:hypothetical protein
VQWLLGRRLDSKIRTEVSRVAEDSRVRSWKLHMANTSGDM